MSDLVKSGWTAVATKVGIVGTFSTGGGVAGTTGGAGLCTGIGFVVLGPPGAAIGFLVGAVTGLAAGTAGGAVLGAKVHDIVEEAQTGRDF